MTEQQIVSRFLASPRNLASRTEAVNALRHLMMDPFVFDTKNDEVYMSIYRLIMELIQSRYPLLSWEVQRQMAKKKRWQEKRTNERGQLSVHI